MSYGLLAPGLEVITHGGFAARLRVLDPGLVYVFNKRCYVLPDGTADGRFEIYDKNAPGGPKWQLALRVPLSDDGSLRPADEREIDALHQSRQRRVSDVLDEFDARADRRDQAIVRHSSNLAESMADDMKFAFRTITSTVESRNRTREHLREQIRDAATV